MATWDSADLLARCKLEAAQPATSAFPTDANWYAWLTEAQREWVGVFAAQVPWVMMGAPTLMSTADSGLTYTFSGSITPLAVEIYESPTGPPLLPGAYWDGSGTRYVWEGSRIRWPRNATRTFGDGPYARYITPPTVIDGSTAPTLAPDYARILLVYRALRKWATRGGLRDPKPFADLERLAWVGDPQIGDVGILGTLKMQNPMLGASAYEGQYVTGLDYIAQVEGYTAI